MSETFYLLLVNTNKRLNEIYNTWYLILQTHLLDGHQTSIIVPREEIKLFIKNVNNPENKNYFSERVRDFKKIFPDEKKVLEYKEQKEIVKSTREEYEKNVELFEKTKKNLIEENENKKEFSLTYIFYDNSNVLKPTFVGEIEQYVNIFSQFAIFSEKNNRNFKNFRKNNKIFFFQLKNNYTGEKEFSLALRKLDGSPTKFVSNKVSIVFLIKSQKNGRKRKKYNAMSIADTFIVLGIQDRKQLTTLNPTFIDISNSPSFLDFVGRFPPSNFIYMFKLMSMILSASIVNLDNDILVTCVGLNKCKKANVNGVQENTLAIIHTENVANWEQLKNTSSWINIGRAQTNLENLEKTVFFVTLRENLENSVNFQQIFQIPGKLREFC